MSEQISNKDLISKFKDYADIADATYAMLHWVNENEKNALDDLYNKAQKDNIPESIINSYKKQELEKPIWRYADGVTKGDILKANVNDKYGNILRKAGDPTAYALAIEARFNQDMVIKVPQDENEKSSDKPEQRAIENKVQNFIKVNKTTKQQRVFLNEF